MNLKLYNTLSRSLEEFTPIDPNNVRIYSCGPTVYREPSIGNLRKYFLDDLLKNVIKHILWYPTTHVVNITDVWHLTWENEGDADHGEDKMEKAARRDGISAREVAKKYEEIFHWNCRTLKLDPFDVTPRATEHIPEQIAMIQELENKWYTYSIPGDWIYFDTSKMPNYGELVGQKHLDGIQSWSRVQDAGKHNPTDFALWKYNITWKKRDMEWDSPWWIGFPGRHIECSAMSIKYLWNHFDIHTGWIDHIPVHHTNEIAQSECSHGDHPWVNYRIHYQFLNINNQKISKSSGNIIKLQDILDRGYKPEDFRYFFLQAHYKSFQDFTWEALEAAKAARSNLKRRIQVMSEKQGFDMKLISHRDFMKVTGSSIAVRDRRITADGLLHDLNTPELLASISKLVNERARWNNTASITIEDLKVLFYLDHYVLKLWLFEQEDTTEVTIPEEIQQWAQQRRQAKQEKNRALADELRQKIDEAWYSILDANDHYTVQGK